MGINTEDCVHLNHINLILAEENIAWFYFWFETIVMRITFLNFVFVSRVRMHAVMCGAALLAFLPKIAVIFFL